MVRNNHLNKSMLMVNLIMLKKKYPFMEQIVYNVILYVNLVILMFSVMNALLLRIEVKPLIVNVQKVITMMELIAKYVHSLVLFVHLQQSIKNVKRGIILKIKIV